jgi:serine/threonine-protein kinase
MIGLTISGRYRIHKLVGQGGMGKVFEAQQIPLGRSVALKVLDARHVEREFARRFYQEAAILARLKSRHTVTIYDYGRDGDHYFIAMELVAGPSLDRLLESEGPLAVARAVSIAEQVCRSLREAHAQGIIHRDLKPANVMLTVTEDGEELAKVLDFGLAKRTDRNSYDETQAYIVPGSPKYMAPEAINQQPIDGRVDMYALGVMLYYMLAGAVPFDRENPLDILRAHLHEQPRPLRATNRKVQVPDALEQIVMRCLAKTPEGRFADMQQLLDALREFGRSMPRSSAPRWAPSTLPPAASNPPASSRPSSPLRLGLDRQDARTPSVSFAPDARNARRVWLAAALIAIAITGFAVLRSARSDGPTSAAPAPLQASTVPAAQPVQSAIAGTAPATAGTAASNNTAQARGVASMVITVDEAAAHPPIALHVTSDPAGAAVFVNGKKLGFTPGDFSWTPEQANPNRPLLVQLRRTGYSPHSIKYAASVPRIDLDATLQPLPPKRVPKSVAPGAATQNGDGTGAEPTEAASDDNSESSASDEPEAESTDPPAPEP